MKTAGYIALYVLIQAISLVLFVIGLPLVAVLAVSRYYYGVGIGLALSLLWHWKGGKWTWLWGNDVDGIFGPVGPISRWQAFYWCALRNPVNNLRFVPGVSKVGRPLWRKFFGKSWYVQAGWNDKGYPVLSAGHV